MHLVIVLPPCRGHGENGESKWDRFECRIHFDLNEYTTVHAACAVLSDDQQLIVDIFYVKVRWAVGAVAAVG